jgi:hypothetical protein
MWQRVSTELTGWREAFSDPHTFLGALIWFAAGGTIAVLAVLLADAGLDIVAVGGLASVVALVFYLVVVRLGG